MPECRRCGRVTATAEQRKLPKGGYACKDGYTCKNRVKALLSPRTAREVERTEK